MATAKQKAWRKEFAEKYAHNRFKKKKKKKK